VLLAAYVITAAGVPLPSGRQVYKSDELFPCAKSTCGCRTAEQCWRSCCCHSFAERIAWARTHGVRPPDYAIAQAKAAGLDMSWLGRSTDTIACNSKACCEVVQIKPAHSCCEKRLAASSTKPARSCCSHQHNSHPSTSTATRVVAWQSLKCNGQSQNWLAAVPILIVVRHAHSKDLPFSGWLKPLVSDRALSLPDRPAVPPPEAV
jgi:hypothetical protein